MEIPTQYNEIGKVIPASSTICQINHVVERAESRRPTISYGSPAGVRGPVGQSSQARPEPIDGETQGIGQFSIVHQKAQYLVSPNLGTVELAVGLKGITGPKEARPVTILLGRVPDVCTMRLKEGTDELGPLDKSTDAHKVPACVPAHGTRAHAVEELDRLDDIAVQHNGFPGPDIHQVGVS